MSALAGILADRGYQVSGSDMKESAVVQRLRGIGGQVFIGHAASNIDGVHVVVRSTAVPNHPRARASPC